VTPSTSGYANPLTTRLARRFEPLVLSERWREFAGGHAVEPGHEPHLVAAIDWLSRAQDSTGSGGIARGYSLSWNPYFELRGWEPAYPETTGYIIPTLYAAARRLKRPELAERARRAAEWECAIQLPSGAVRGGVVGQPTSPAVFNTGQVIFGWLSAYAETGDAKFELAAVSAARYLVSVLDDDGIWRRDNSRFALSHATLYNARVSWALAEVGQRLGMPEATDAAARSLEVVASRQRANGWIPNCCLTDPGRPLLHTIAYAIRGMLEGGRLLQDSRLIDHAAKAAAAIADSAPRDGALAGRFDENWRPAANWSCLTGDAQMAGVWLRLFELTNDAHWLEPVVPVIRFLKSTQNRTSADPGLRGGIKGSGPLTGGYGANETLSWAAKFFADLLLRHERVVKGDAVSVDASDLLA
jgi:nitrogen fixation protein FixH